MIDLVDPFGPGRRRSISRSGCRRCRTSRSWAACPPPQIARARVAEPVGEFAKALRFGSTAPCESADRHLVIVARVDHDRVGIARSARSSLPARHRCRRRRSGSRSGCAHGHDLASSAAPSCGGTAWCRRANSLTSIARSRAACGCGRALPRSPASRSRDRAVDALARQQQRARARPALRRPRAADRARRQDRRSRVNWYSAAMRMGGRSVTSAPLAGRRDADQLRSSVTRTNIGMVRCCDRIPARVNPCWSRDRDPSGRRDHRARRSAPSARRTV